MRKLFEVLCIAILCMTFLISAQEAPVTGEVVTGEAVTASVGPTVFVIAAPSITLHHPENKTYLRGTQLINYTTSGGTNVTYSIDGGINNSISTPTNISFSQGPHQLDLWADNGEKTLITVYFTINSSKLTINYSEYNGSQKGISTDFYTYAYEDLLNLSGIILEHTSYGKAEFNTAINVENDSDTTDLNVNLDNNTQLGANSITLNATALPNFNKPATISLYALSFTNPEPLLNGALCSPPTCTEISYSGGTFVFTVNGFSGVSTYSSRETTTQQTSGGGGGGGGSTTVRTLDIITLGYIEIGANDEIIVPVTFNNPDTLAFRGISISAKPNNETITAQFKKNTIDILPGGENETITLFITSKGTPPKDYAIEITATSTSPAFTVSESIVLRSVETIGKAQVVERVVLAQELFKENPECLELNDLLINAQNLLNQGNIEAARTLVSEAIIRCRDLITNQESPKPPSFDQLGEWKTPVIIALILIIIALTIFTLVKRPNLHLKKGTRKTHQTITTTKKQGFWNKLFKRRKKKKSGGSKKPRHDEISGI